MTLQEYRDEIKLSLGYPVVKLEISDDDFDKLIGLAFKEVRRVITDSKLITVPYEKMIDLTEYKVNTVVRILRASNNGIYDLTSLDPLTISASVLSNTSSVDTSTYARYLLANQIKNTISTDLDFIWEKPVVMINANYPYPFSVTIIYIPMYNDIEEVDEDHWERLIYRLALAFSKQVLGRVRGKYKLSNVNYSLDSDELLQEASTEIAEIRTYLNENSDTLFPMD